MHVALMFFGTAVRMVRAPGRNVKVIVGIVVGGSGQLSG
jgi:hypothetical protein